MPALRSIGRAIAAGAVGLVVNFAALGLADHLGIVTARGGFQRLAKLWAGPLLVHTGGADAWAGLGLPDPASPLFVAGFKIGAGLAMALVYWGLESWLPGPWWRRGLYYAATVWLVNAAFVLPLLGEGFAGVDDLTIIGMTVFAAAHTAFFLVLAGLYAFQAPVRSNAGE